MKQYYVAILLVVVFVSAMAALPIPTHSQPQRTTGRLSDSVLTVHCEVPDTIFADQTSGTYINNPFQLKATITNPTDVAYRNVQAAALSFAAGIKVGTMNPASLGDIAPHTSLQVTWELNAGPHAVPTNEQVCVFVTAHNHVTVECCPSVHLTAIPVPELDVVCTLEPSDTLFFNERTGWTSLPELRLKAVISNNGQGTATRVRGTALLPVNMLLQAGETAIKPIAQRELRPGGTDTLVWKVVPVITPGTGNPDWLEFEVLVSTDYGQPVKCRTKLYLRAFSRLVDLKFPEYTFLRYREKRNVPLRISRTVGIALSEYVVRVQYDPTMLRVIGVSTSGTLTEQGWTPASLGYIDNERVELSASGSALETEEGVLLNLQIEGVLGRDHGAGSFGWSVLHIDTSRSTLNRGAISFTAGDGNVIATDDCLEPLVHAGGSTLKQNRPNPFNPTTLIEYTLSEKEYIRLRVFDSHGRDVAVLVDGVQESGPHAAAFDAESLPSGMYFYRLETPRGFETRKMLLMR